MTVIALFADLDLTFFDCLLSRRHHHEEAIVLPSVGMTTEVATHVEDKPSKASRKAHVLKHGDQRGVLLFSGGFPDIDGFVRDLELTKVGVADCRDALTDCLRRARDDRRDNFCVLGTLDGTLVRGGLHPSARTDHPYFGTVYAAGLGRSLLEDELNARAEGWEARLPKDDADKRLRIGCSLPSIMLQHDTMDSRLTWKAGVGGYYESLLNVGGSWRPVADRLHLFASIDHLESKRLVEVRRLLYHAYRDGWILTCSLAGPTLESEGGARGFGG